MEFIISQTDDVLISHAGLSLAGALLQRTELRQRLDTMEVEGLKRSVMPEDSPSSRPILPATVGGRTSHGGR